MDLLKKKKNKLAVVNKDDPYSSIMLENCKVPVLTYGIKALNLDLQAANIVLQQNMTRFDCIYQGKKIEIQSPLIGNFNIYNVLAAIAVALQAGIALFSAVKGRLEKVDNPKNLNIYVDFAHTDKALENVLATVRAVTQGKLIVVAGCGGDRDQGKRSLMGQVAQTLADVAIFTSDNPRSEDPSSIIQQMMTLVKSKKNILIEPDRKAAIEKALELAKEQDSVVIAGKGHETTQIFKDKTVHFSDVSIVQEFFSK
jgi:UDP-N-acetylmuramoyl-L-alanyl-D-glutamate--2,6-diaminopimelate ligase